MLNRFKNVVVGVVGGSEVNGIHPGADIQSRTNLPPKFPYNRPHFLNLGDDEVQMSADHRLRPIIHPSQPLPHNAGYAECINAGKSRWNEDQAVYRQGILTKIEQNENGVRRQISIPYTYYGMFDGHAGVGAALCAANQLHHILHEKLVDAQDDIWADFVKKRKCPSHSRDLLITGALEAAFKEMDQLIAEDRSKYQAAGGCTALVALFLLGKLYVANAGDSRAVICQDTKVIPMSVDFTPENERERIRVLAEQNPALLGKDFTSREYLKRPESIDLGKRIMYRDAHMKGWAYKTVQAEDLKVPVVTGQGKRSRIMGTIGVARGFGDHDLLGIYEKIPLKPFLSAHPEIQSRSLIDAIDNEVLVMATDGLWDVVNGAKATEIVSKSLKSFSGKQKYISAATCLVGSARGSLSEHSWQLKDKKPASGDDISVFVIALLPYRMEFEEFLAKHSENKKDIVGI